MVMVLGLFHNGQAGSSKPEFTLRFFMQAAKGTNPAQVIALNVPNPDQIIPVNKFAVLTEKHVASMMKLPNGGTLVTLTDSGSKIMDTETSNNVGNVMVVLCNGRVIYAPEIDAPLRSGKIMLPPGLVDSDYQLFENYVKKREKM